jgi:hypothetical protein
VAKANPTPVPWSVNRRANWFVDAGPNGDGLEIICECDPEDEMFYGVAAANAAFIVQAANGHGVFVAACNRILRRCTCEEASCPTCRILTLALEGKESI